MFRTSLKILSLGRLIPWRSCLALIFCGILFGLFHAGSGFLDSVIGQSIRYKIRAFSQQDSPQDTNATENVASREDRKHPERAFHPMIHQAAERYQVDPAIVKAVIKMESGYNPRAISKKGAKGLMQLMPRTARALGVKDCFDPAHNIDAGVRYLKHLMEQLGGDLKLALAAYNAGIRTVRQHNGIPPFKATRRYVKKVFEYYRYYAKEHKSEPRNANKEIKISANPYRM